MAANNTSTEISLKKTRPLGIWLITLFGFFIGGILPLSFEPMDLLKGYTAFYSSDDIPDIKIIAFLSLVIILTSIFTWKGLRIGQILFVVSTTIFFLKDGIFSFYWGTRLPVFGDVQGWLRYITDFGFPVICIWYFNKPSTKEFYRKMEHREKTSGEAV